MINAVNLTSASFMPGNLQGPAECIKSKSDVAGLCLQGDFAFMIEARTFLKQKDNTKQHRVASILRILSTLWIYES